MIRRCCCTKSYERVNLFLLMLEGVGTAQACSPLLQHPSAQCSSPLISCTRLCLWRVNCCRCCQMRRCPLQPMICSAFPDQVRGWWWRSLPAAVTVGLLDLQHKAVPGRLFHASCLSMLQAACNVEHSKQRGHSRGQACSGQVKSWT